MDTNELMYNFLQLSAEDRLTVVTEMQRKISVEVTNETLSRMELFFPLVITLTVSTDDSIKQAFSIWEEYWEKENSGYSSYAYFTLFVLEMAHRQEEEKKFAAELEAM
jgi:hypothetical protein